MLIDSLIDCFFVANSLVRYESPWGQKSDVRSQPALFLLDNMEASREMTYLKLYVPVAPVMFRSVNCTGFRADVIVVRGAITISTDSWLNRRANKVEKAAQNRRNVTVPTSKAVASKTMALEESAGRSQYRVLLHAITTPSVRTIIMQHCLLIVCQDCAPSTAALTPWVRALSRSFVTLLLERHDSPVNCTQMSVRPPSTVCSPWVAHVKL